METLKVWINSNEVLDVINGKRPSKYWIDRPVGLMNLTEITIKPAQLKEWSSNNTKILLHD